MGDKLIAEHLHTQHERLDCGLLELSYNTLKSIVLLAKQYHYLVSGHWNTIKANPQYPIISPVILRETFFGLVFQLLNMLLTDSKFSG